MKVCVITNPVAGGGRGKTMAEALCKFLEVSGETVELVLTQKVGDAKDEAQRAVADCVVAVGGDGSVNEVVNGLANSDAMLCVLPAGTANVVARALRMPKDPATVAGLITAGRTRWIDVGLHGEHRFLLGAGAGLDAEIVRRVSAQRGRKSNLTKWVGPAVRTILSYSYPRFEVLVDGKVVSDRAQYAIVGNCRYSAAVFPATPEAKMDDGLLDVCILEDLGALRMMSHAINVWRPGFTHRKGVRYYQSTSIEFQAAPGVEIPLQVDGDPGGYLPASFGIEANAVRVIAPPP